MKLALNLLTLPLLASAGTSKETMLAEIKARLSMGGANNCQYKCANLFNLNNLWDEESGNAELNGLSPGSPSSVLNEFLGCFAGCQMCEGGENVGCMKDCKNTPWFNVNWWYNPYTGGTNFFACEEDLLKTQTQCITDCGNPGTDSRAQLPVEFTDCTQKCYDDPVTGIAAINLQCNKLCKEGATCDTYDGDGNDCSTTDVTAQYTEDMCGSSVLKNIIEPDKACQFGCVQNLCQDGAGCTGTGLWHKETDYANCQMITPQSNGQKYTIIPAIFEHPEQTDVSGCCTQAKVCCEYKSAWAAEHPQQRTSVCNVASNKNNCGKKEVRDKTGFVGKIQKGTYPGDGCTALWKDGGFCQAKGFKCQGCTQ